MLKRLDINIHARLILHGVLVCVFLLQGKIGHDTIDTVVQQKSQVVPLSTVLYLRYNYNLLLVERLVSITRIGN